MVVWVEGHEPLPLPGSVSGDGDGLVAAGGRLTPERLEEAYRLGLFPWFGPGQPVLWWSPDPRMVLEPAAFQLARSLRRTLARFLATPGCEIAFDRDCPAVIEACASTPREGQDGTWIVPAMRRAYGQWHQGGRVHSVETRIDGELVGGLYFVSIGRMVFGESMFSHLRDASKLALAALVAACRARGVPLIDCQQRTGHLASFGAVDVARADFQVRMRQALAAPDIVDWTYDDSLWGALDSRLMHRPTLA